jgi:hypothetical protein
VKSLKKRKGPNREKSSNFAFTLVLTIASTTSKNVKGYPFFATFKKKSVLGPFYPSPML